MTERRQVLVLSFFPAFVPPNNGGVARLFNFYAELSRFHDVTLISSSFVDGEREVVRHLPSFTEVRVPKDKHFTDAYADLAAGGSGEGDLSGPALGVASHHLGALHDEYLAHYPTADFIIHDSPFLIECDLFRGFDSKLRIYNSYNCEFELYSSFHSAASDRIERLVFELERELCRHSDLITVCSQEDGAAFERHFAPEAPIILAPNGFTPGPPLLDAQRAPRSVVFLGSAHQPNVDAVRLIMDEIAPKLRNVEFHLVGSCHAKGRMRNVTAHGVISQEKKQALLRTASAAINPMTSGGGSSLKIADIASNSCPLISTALGARGFGLAEGVHYIALDPLHAAATIEAALDDRQRLNDVARNAYDHFERHYSWREIVADFVGKLGDLQTKNVRVPARLVLNDYDSLDSVGGGATRTTGLCNGLAETAPVIFMAFATDDKPRRRVSEDGRVLSLLVGKTAEHHEENTKHNLLHWISTADIVSYRHATNNSRLMALFRAAAVNCSGVICEHPYMVGVPRAFGVEFVYSSQNYEGALKAESLSTHPLRDRLLPLVREAEAFACGSSNFIVAVSDKDAANFGAQYQVTAPILVIPNGADGPVHDDEAFVRASGSERPAAIFMGSLHGPNCEAAQWIASELAREVPEWDFVIIGSVTSSISGTLSPNVELCGEVTPTEKTRRLYAAQVALNPMMSGSGSNVKMADYLQHGLPVLTTSFGARGYDWLPTTDSMICDLADFKRELGRLRNSDRVAETARAKRQAKYHDLLSMDAGGRRLAQLIEQHSGERRRAMYVTYRYTEPARGGGEEHVVRLVHALAASGWEVDVCSPASREIVDLSRFEATFPAAHAVPIPTGQARVSSRKFALSERDPANGAALQRIWNFQPEFENEVVHQLTPPSQPCLAWGWADPDGDGRWCFRNAGFYLPTPGTLILRGRALAPLWLRIVSAEGRQLYEVDAEREVEVACELPAGFVSLQFSVPEVASIGDPRPLAAFVRTCTVEGRSLLDDRVSDVWTAANSPARWMTALGAARSAVRDAHDLELTPLRGASEDLEDHVRAFVGDYDLLITHNAVFQSTIAAIAAADAAQVPSILIPHLHYDDDFYHFQDILSTCASATRTLVCPRSALELLEQQGLSNVLYHAPGVDVSDADTEADIATFHDVLPEKVDDFFLILGRKSAAKGYRDVFAALDEFPKGEAPTIVMIGADDDGEPIAHPAVMYLGRQPDAVVRGALAVCLGLINMSRSESFGMVLVQAGLASKPVLANRNCAAFLDLVENGVNGFLVSREDLALRMQELRRSPEQRRKLGEAGRARALRHNWATIESDFVALCDQLVASA